MFVLCVCRGQRGDGGGAVWRRQLEVELGHVGAQRGRRLQPELVLRQSAPPPARGQYATCDIYTTLLLHL